MSAGPRAHALFTTSFGLLSESSGSLLSTFSSAGTSGNVWRCFGLSKFQGSLGLLLVCSGYRSDTLLNNALNSHEELSSSKWR